MLCWNKKIFLPYGNRQPLHAMLQLQTLVFTHDIIIYNIFNALSKRTTFVLPIEIDYFYMHCCKKLFHKYYSNSQLLHALLDIPTSGFTVANEKLYVTAAFTTFASGMAIADLYWHYCN